ncbi:MAG: hypothetical protein CMF42_06085 [Legionellales bacterium]|nr:hypothetical protein [Legionellales bacterium]OUX66980.1 MAG: hypothetical protein CBD38_04430 [bacterium TMED178]|tara:strand:+ start:2259 stop:3266 length:1008 start_codon:yes stop_codon:yes gene_type:complete
MSKSTSFDRTESYQTDDNFLDEDSITIITVLIYLFMCILYSPLLLIEVPNYSYFSNLWDVVKTINLLSFVILIICAPLFIFLNYCLLLIFDDYYLSFDDLMNTFNCFNNDESMPFDSDSEYSPRSNARLFEDSVQNSGRQSLDLSSLSDDDSNVAHSRTSSNETFFGNSTRQSPEFLYLLDDDLLKQPLATGYNKEEKPEFIGDRLKQLITLYCTHNNIIEENDMMSDFKEALQSIDVEIICDQHYFTPIWDDAMCYVPPNRKTPTQLFSKSMFQKMEEEYEQNPNFTSSFREDLKDCTIVENHRDFLTARAKLIMGALESACKTRSILKNGAVS